MKKIKSLSLIAFISATIAMVLIALLEYLFFSRSFDKAYFIQKLTTYCIVIITLYIGLKKTNGLNRPQNGKNND